MDLWIAGLMGENGIMEYWNVGVRGYRIDGFVDYWIDVESGMMEFWNNGILE